MAFVFMLIGFVFIVLAIGALVGGVLKLMDSSHAGRIDRAAVLHSKIKREHPDHPAAQFSPREMQHYYKSAKRTQKFVPWAVMLSGFLVFLPAGALLLEVPGDDALLGAIACLLASVTFSLFGARLLHARHGQEWLLNELVRQSQTIT